MTLIDMVGDTIRGIFDNWQEAPEPPARPRTHTRPAGMNYCPVCKCKSFTEYLVKVDTGPRVSGPSIRPMWVHGHDQCVDLLARAYEQETAANHEWDFAAIEATYHRSTK